MTYVEVPISTLFQPTNGRPKYIRDYVDAHAGDHPVYSASLTKAFGLIDTYDYEGHYLTWVMNGYGGRVQEVSGKFSANRDRGVFVPRAHVEIPDLTFLRSVIEPQLTAAAVGRRVDGRLNEYTKIYPDAAGDITIQIPLTPSGEYDFEAMKSAGERIRRIELSQRELRVAQDTIDRAVFAVEIADPTQTISLGNTRYFDLSIGERVLSSQHSDGEFPAYSANALVPFGHVSKSNIDNFERDSLLWGIDGNFDWNLIESSKPFAHTDHCGRLQISDPLIDPKYAYWFLKLTRDRYGFDRVFRSSLTNMREEVEITVPVNAETGLFDLDRQRELAKLFEAREIGKIKVLTAIDDVLKARMSAIA